MKLLEVYRKAEYMDIILSLLAKPYSVASVTKILFFSFCIYHETNPRLYQNRTKDVVDIFFRNTSFKLLIDCADIKIILSDLEILTDVNFISIEKDKIEIKKQINHITENEFIKRCQKNNFDPISEINKLDADSVIGEVLRYV